MSSLRHNETVDTLLNRRSIRTFLNEPIDEDIVATLETVAQHAASSQFLNDWSAIRVEDENLKQALAEIGTQSYIATAPLLYVFVVDQHRNAAIARAQGMNFTDDEFMLSTFYRFSQAQNDAVLALHAMETAAESFGLGTVILGSILNDIERLTDVLRLPKYTYPVLGLAIGKPNQAPTLKPRMSRDMQIFKNYYPKSDADLLSNIADFDERVHQYYDLRNANKPVAAFSEQVCARVVDEHAKELSVDVHLKKQGFSWC